MQSDSEPAEELAILLNDCGLDQVESFFSSGEHLEEAPGILPKLNPDVRVTAVKGLITFIANLKDDVRQGWIADLAQVLASDVECFRQAAGCDYPDSELDVAVALVQKIKQELQILAQQQDRPQTQTATLTSSRG